MKKFTVHSKKYGDVTTLLDDEDYEAVANRPGGRKPGSWSVSLMRDKFYFEKREGNKLIKLHRLLVDAPAGKWVDHISKDTLDNRKSNLRICSNSANLRNGRLRPHNTSGVTGVYWSKDRLKWCAQIRVRYRVVPLGRYKIKDEAIQARKAAEAKYWSV